MNAVSDVIKAFFEVLERGNNTLDMAVIDSQYGDTFMFGDPGGARVIEKQKFLAALPRRQEFFNSLGHKFTRVILLDETRLDDHYVLVEAHFLMHFEPPSTQPVDALLDSTFILFIKEDTPRIVMHIEHHDLQQAMRERGLLPIATATAIR
jgi:hypothetical protein